MSKFTYWLSVPHGLNWAEAVLPRHEMEREPSSETLAPELVILLPLRPSRPPPSASFRFQVLRSSEDLQSASLLPQIHTVAGRLAEQRRGRVGNVAPRLRLSTWAEGRMWRWRWVCRSVVVALVRARRPKFLCPPPQSSFSHLLGIVAIPVDAVTPYCRPPRPWRPAAKCPSPMRHPAPATAQAKQMG